MNDSTAAVNVSVPYFPASASILLAPTLTEAMEAQRSPSSTSGMRELTLMICITGSLVWPRAMSLIAGSRRPSWKIEVAAPVSEPGAMPPTSEWCAMVAVQAIRSPPWNTGIITTMSLRCVTPP